MTTPEWLKVGATVAIQLPSRGGRRVIFARVEKIGKRDIVLGNGDRFNVNTLSRHVAGTWGDSFRLKPSDDPDVLQDAEKDKRDAAAREVTRLMSVWREKDYNDIVAVRAINVLRNAIGDGAA